MKRQLHPMLDLAAWDAANACKSLVIADGAKVEVSVYGSRLVIKDGPMGDARTRIYERVPHTFNRLAILSSHGSMSLDAMAWLQATDRTWTVLDRTRDFARCLGTNGVIDARYVRQQSLCGQGMPNHQTVGIPIVRGLITAKLEGQAYNAERILRDDKAAETIRAFIPRVQRARDVKTILSLEGNAADVYWDVWRGMPVSYLRPGPRQAHWLTYPSRRTLRRHWETNRDAVEPINAMLNFGYWCAEIEAIHACNVHGLSSFMGICHVDQTGRHSFALDLIEVMRPAVDRIILDILAERLNHKWFAERSDGVVRCCAPITHRITADVHQAAYRITQAIDPILRTLEAVQPTKRNRVAVSA